MNYYLHTAGLLISAFLFGGMLFFSAGFAAFAFKALPLVEARQLIRKAFPPFYLFVMGTAAVAAALLFTVDSVSALLMLIIALTTLPNRQFLMPAVNRATDKGERKKFAQLHGLSVLITLAHIVASAVVIVRLMNS